MPRRRLAAAGLGVLGGLVGFAAGCGDEGDDGPAEQLAEQVAAVLVDGAEDVRVRLEVLGVPVERAEIEAVGAGDVSCPSVEGPAAGDRATCAVALTPADILVDVEFGAGGEITLVGVEVGAVRGGDPEVESAVRRLVADRIDDSAGEVAATCPGVSGLDDVDTGDAVRCRFSVGGGADQPVDLTVDADGALVLSSAILDRTEVEAFLAGELEGPAEGTVSVSCGDEPAIVGAVGGSFACEAVRAADGEAFDVRVVVRSLDGELEYSVAGR